MIPLEDMKVQKKRGRKKKRTEGYYGGVPSTCSALTYQSKTLPKCCVMSVLEAGIQRSHDMKKWKVTVFSSSEKKNFYCGTFKDKTYAARYNTCVPIVARCRLMPNQKMRNDQKYERFSVCVCVVVVVAAAVAEFTIWLVSRFWDRMNISILRRMTTGGIGIRNHFKTCQTRSL